ncbi:hypothetical protein BRC67_10685 [Halobacteriales archaeon QH_3_68_24]|nr:MAG: hypothetical protein BRC67_10685 [Halobacteriales archaeon QH_3_68_24]
MSASDRDSGWIGTSVDPTATPRAETPRWTVRGVALGDISAAGSALVWTGVSLAGLFTPVEQALALAPLVLVPLGARMAARPRFRGLADRAHAAATLCQPVGALLVTLSLVVESGVGAAALAAPWVVVTALFGLAGLARFRDRLLAASGDGTDDGSSVLRALLAPETLIDAGLGYATVGSVALVLWHLGATFRFEPVIILLTAVHFHYAGFVLPVFMGLAGRCIGPAGDRVYRPLAGVVLVGPAFIAVGISFSPLVEIAAVGAFTTAVAALGGYVALRVAAGRPRFQRFLVRVAALALPVSMAMALGYGVGAFTGNPPLGLTLDTMVALHGSLNAYGFGFFGVAGWRLSVPVGPGRVE